MLHHFQPDLVLGEQLRQLRYRRLVGALARRGFSSSVAHRVYREVLGELPEAGEA